MVPRSVLVVVSVFGPVLLPVLVVACGGGSSRGGDISQFIGVYTTTSHTRAETPGTPLSCTDRGQPVADATPYFKLDVDSFFMDPDLLRVSECSDAAGASCTETAVAMHAGGPGLIDESANSQTGGGATCQLHYTRAEARLTGATSELRVEIDLLEKYDAPDIAERDCTVERAEALATATACRRIERWAGTRQ